MKTKFGTGQIKQLIEIDDAMTKNGLHQGIGEQVQSLIKRLTQGNFAGWNDTSRLQQAKRYWDFGIGQAAGYCGFMDYLASVPEIPELPNPRHHPVWPLGHWLLVEPRPLVRAMCAFTDVLHDAGDYVPRSRRFAGQRTPYWINYRALSALDEGSADDAFTESLKEWQPMTLLEGVCLVFQIPSEADDLRGEKYGRHLVLAGSVKKDGGRFVPSLVKANGRWVVLGHHPGQGVNSCVPLRCSLI
jgi:hypothetical protein